jgi:thiopurine S-methyltransferase
LHEIRCFILRSCRVRQWAERSLGWHESHVHDAIVTYGDRFIPGWSMTDQGECAVPAAGAARVFFPLCGKTVDMAAVAKHPAVAQVVGVDGVRTALDEFAAEHPYLGIREEDGLSSGPEPAVASSSSRYERRAGDKILLLRGDFFDLDETATNGQFDAVFDRASLVAIDPALRSDYVQVMRKLIRPGGKILLVVIERMSGNDEEDQTAGPPFTVPEAHVRALYETQEWVKAVTLLEEKEPEGDRKMRSVYYLVETKTA